MKMKLLLGLFFLIFSGLFAEESPPAWMMEQIEADFAHFEKIEEDEMFLMDRKALKQNNMCHCKVENNKVLFFGKNLGDSNFLEVEYTLNELIKRYQLPDMNFFVCFEDHYFGDKNPVPLLVFSKMKNAKTQVRIPTDCDCNTAIPWEFKKTPLLWRGDTIGGSYNSANWRSYPRSKAVLLSLEYPDKIDARFREFVQGAQHVTEMLKMSELLGDYECPCKFKYHLFFEDPLNFYYDSLIFRQKNDRVRWYDGVLKENEHYVPVAEDLSDLLEKVDWAWQHDEEAHKIAENCAQLCSSKLNTDARYLYWYLVLLKYAQLF